MSPTAVSFMAFPVRNELSKAPGMLDLHCKSEMFEQACQVPTEAARRAHDLPPAAANEHPRRARRSLAEWRWPTLVTPADNRLDPPEPERRMTHGRALLDLAPYDLRQDARLGG